jgi:hypothetical protein
MGRIVDVIVSRDGQIHAAIIDFGGFLGIGIRKIAVDWNALNFAPVGKPGTIPRGRRAKRACGRLATVAISPITTHGLSLPLRLGQGPLPGALQGSCRR